MPKNYYLVLGITPKATLDDIKDAYRRLVKKFHPDHYGENHGPFLAIQEAYTVLSDPIKRENHDFSVQQHKKPRTRGFQQNNRYRPGKVEPLIPKQKPLENFETQQIRSFNSDRPAFDQLFNRIFNNFGPSEQSKNKRLTSFNVVMTLTPDQASRGGQAILSLPVEYSCPSCSGQGWIGPYECWECSTRGRIFWEYPLIINYPPGILNHHVVKVPLNHYGIKEPYLIVRFRITWMR